MNLKPLTDYIKKHISLTEAEEAILAEHVTYRKYQKGQYVVQQGDVCRHESFILSGCLRMYHLDEAGLEHIIMFSIENWWSGDIGSFITKSPADFNVQCLETTEVLQFSYDNLEKIYKLIPKYERFMRLIIQNAFVSSQKRIVRDFSLPAKERYLIFRDQYPLIEQRVPQYMIASYLGITKEFLSKIRSRLISEQ